MATCSGMRLDIASGSLVYQGPVRLMQHDGRLAFQEPRPIQALGMPQLSRPQQVIRQGLRLIGAREQIFCGHPKGR